MGWAFFYMFVILKIPIAGALYLVWWSTREDPEPVDGQDRGGGSDRHHGGNPRRPRPRPPRRGPHAHSPPRSPQRIRARGKLLAPTHGRP